MSLYVSVYTMSSCLCADVSFFLLSRHVFYVSCLLKCVPCFCMCLCVLCLLVCVSGFHVFACESVFHVSVYAYVYHVSLFVCLCIIFFLFSVPVYHVSCLCMCVQCLCICQCILCLLVCVPLYPFSFVCACVPCLLFVKVCSMSLYGHVCCLCTLLCTECLLVCVHVYYVSLYMNVSETRITCLASQPIDLVTMAEPFIVVSIGVKFFFFDVTGINF